MSNLLLPKGYRPPSKPRINADDSVSVPFQTEGGGQVVVTFTVEGYANFVTTMDDMFLRIQRRRRMAGEILDINRHESVV